MAETQGQGAPADIKIETPPVIASPTEMRTAEQSGDSSVLQLRNSLNQDMEAQGKSWKAVRARQNQELVLQNALGYLDTKNPSLEDLRFVFQGGDLPLPDGTSLNFPGILKDFTEQAENAKSPDSQVPEKDAQERLTAATTVAERINNMIAQSTLPPERLHTETASPRTEIRTNEQAANGIVPLMRTELTNAELAATKDGIWQAAEDRRTERKVLDMLTARALSPQNNLTEDQITREVLKTLLHKRDIQMPDGTTYTNQGLLEQLRIEADKEYSGEPKEAREQRQALYRAANRLDTMITYYDPAESKKIATPLDSSSVQRGQESFPFPLPTRPRPEHSATAAPQSAVDTPPTDLNQAMRHLAETGNPSQQPVPTEQSTIEQTTPPRAQKLSSLLRGFSDRVRNRLTPKSRQSLDETIQRVLTREEAQAQQRRAELAAIPLVQDTLNDPSLNEADKEYLRRVLDQIAHGEDESREKPTVPYTGEKLPPPLIDAHGNPIDVYGNRIYDDNGKRIIQNPVLAKST